MKPQEIRIGEILDLTINTKTSKTYIVGKVLGVRQDYINPDLVAVMVAGIDQWLTLSDKVEVRYADR
jgi:hypothetical protein